MTKVAVLDLSLNEDMGRKEFDEMPNGQLAEICNEDGLLFTLEAFERYVNDELIDIANCFIRFM